MMSSWLPAWLPALPSIDFSLPSSIQKRFLSFGLRQALGHLLKPGQLDIQQVDSQIGSGFVQVRDVELDNDAINSLIAGLPIRLHDGSVGKVTARIPWPNPLTAAVGLSLESLHLTFNVTPTITNGDPVAVNLAESVTSVAETFIHSELDPDEEAALRDSLHPDLAASLPSIDHVPGGLDPFITDDTLHSDSDPRGVSIFATLLERLLSRFQFDAKDVKITLVHPDNASFTLEIPRIQYQTEFKGEVVSSENAPEDTGQSAGHNQGSTRTVSIAGVTVTTRCLRSQSPLTARFATTSIPSFTVNSSTPPPVYSPSSLEHASPPSPVLSDSSEMDEDTHLMMSQSLVGLPPRPHSPASSIASSMYQSAVSVTSPVYSSTLPPVQAEDRPATPTSPTPQSQAAPIAPTQNTYGAVANEIQDETILSFGLDPIVIRLSTPTATRQTAKEANPSSRSAMDSSRDTRGVTIDVSSEALKLDVKLGVIAAALKARHIRSILDISQLWASHTSSISGETVQQDDQQQQRRSLFQALDMNLQMRGLVAMLLPASQSSSEVTPDPTPLFFERPLVPSQLPYGYIRIHLDTFDAAAFLRPTPEPPSLRKANIKALGTVITASFSLSEISAFAFMNDDVSGGPGELRASPILITDPNLPLQYPSTHNQPILRQPGSSVRLPSFDIIDWTDPARLTSSSKLSSWRTKVPQSTRVPGQGLSPGSPLRASPIRTSSSPRQPVPGPSSPGQYGDSPIRPSLAALSVKFSTTSRPSSSRSSRSRDKSTESHTTLEVDIAPLHVFGDICMILRPNDERASEALLFLEELTSGNVNQNPIPEERDTTDRNEPSSDEEDESTPPATPQPSLPFLRRGNEREQAQERKRLERLVLEDLDLGFDYGGNEPEPLARGGLRHKKRKVQKSSQTDVKITFPMVRLELRASPHPIHSRRSGAVVVDIHDLCLYPGGLSRRKPVTRFADPEGAIDPDGWPVIRQDVEDPLLLGECERLGIAYSVAGAEKASTLFSLGASPLEQGDRQQDWTGSPPAVSRPYDRLRPQFTMSQSSSTTLSNGPDLTTVTLTVDIPAICVNLSKPVLDGLQLWADDLSQMIEKCNSTSSKNLSEGDNSRDPSLIGSRFFAKTRRSQDSGTESASVVSAQRTNANTETILKVFVSDVAARLDVPRGDEPQSQERPFDIVASGIDVLLEVRPEGKDEMVLTLGISELDVMEQANDGSQQVFLTLTKPYAAYASGQSSLKLRFVSLTIPETSAKESRVKVTLSGLTYTVYSDLDWVKELSKFAKAPPGVFESVVPNERTRISIKLADTSVRTLAPSHPGALVLYVGELDLSTVVEGNLPQTSLTVLVNSTSLLLNDDCRSIPDKPIQKQLTHGARGSLTNFWKAQGYALIAELDRLHLKFFSKTDISPADMRITVDGADLRLHLCADSGGVLGAFIGSMTSMFSGSSDQPPETPKKRVPTELASPPSKRSLLASLDEQAFKRQIPEVGPAPDLVNDDLPNNPDYLDTYNAAGGLRPLDDDELDDFDEEYPAGYEQPGIIEKYGGETIRLLDPKGLNITENYFELLPPDSADEANQYGDTTLKLRINDCNVTVLLYDGYDWARTRRIIEEQARDMRRRLAKIRQLVASGQTPDPTVEETNTILFNSVYIGLEHNVDELEPGALIAAIDEQLNEELEIASQSSWQSLKPQQLSPGGHSPMSVPKRHKKKLTRSKGPCIEFRLQSLDAEVDNYRCDPELASRTLVMVQDVEILDHVRTSTWSKFLTSFSTDSKGNIRETGSNMVRVELRKVYPVPGDTTQEARLRAKLLPLRLYVDQDALDFMKTFFSFSDPEAAPAPSEPSEEIFFQQVEVFPVDIKLDYKPRRVDYKALRSGRTIELMNFFHFDGAEMTLRHITLTGITGWARAGDLLNDLWTPDVKATQLVDVISGVAPIRSVVNVGSGMADLVLLPIAQYQKDGRVIRGLQKGTTAFVQSTAIEAIKLGARLATGTQVILEQAEHVIGGQFNDSVVAEAVQSPTEEGDNDHAGTDELISRYAEQPMNVKEGVKSAVKSLRHNLNSAAQTILAVPMEVYERSGNEGAVRAVIRAVPIAVLKPMIGATEAVGKTLMGIHNSLDPNVRTENEAKYKRR